MDFEGAIKYLKTYQAWEDIIVDKYVLKTFDLARIKNFLMKMNVDYKRLKYVHVAGSKGKGTVAKMIGDYLSESACNVGVYTSPPMFRVTECFCVNGKDISEECFVKMVEKLKNFIDDNGCELSYFELLTVLAFKYFSELELDYVVLEVGLGGRLDATNVVTPEISVITTVEKEHSEILGDSLSQILDEKLGIVKEGIPVVVGFQSREGMALIKEKLEGREVLFVEEEEGIDLMSEDGAKVKNGKMAWMVLKRLLGEVNDNVFLKVFEDFRFLGRFDVREINGKTVVFDMAHTENSMRNLIEGLKKRFKDKEFVFLVSILKGKEALVMLKTVGEIADKIVLTSSHLERGYRGEELAEFVDDKEKIEIIENSKLAYKKVFDELKRDQVMVVTGSHFLLSIVMPH